MRRPDTPLLTSGVYTSVVAIRAILDRGFSMAGFSIAGADGSPLRTITPWRPPGITSGAAAPRSVHVHHHALHLHRGVSRRYCARPSRAVES
jgi:hypothetical protein